MPVQQLKERTVKVSSYCKKDQICFRAGGSNVSVFIMRTNHTHPLAVAYFVQITCN